MTTKRLDQHQVGGSHYAQMEITPWQFLEANMAPAEFRGYLKGEALVYVAREAAKAGPLDISKARHCLQKLEEYDAKLAAMAEQAARQQRQAAKLAELTALSQPAKPRRSPAKPRKAARRG